MQDKTTQLTGSEPQIGENLNTPNKGKLSRLPVVLVLVALAILAMFVIYKFTSTNPGSQQIQDELEQPEIVSVAITSDGFSPNTISIKAGSTVEFVNRDTALHAIASDPYPTSDLLPGLKSLNLGEDGSYFYTFDKVGIWGYHDPLNPSEFHGEIVVTE